MALRRPPHISHIRFPRKVMSTTPSLLSPHSKYLHHSNPPTSKTSLNGYFSFTLFHG
jgi:hypothetical protein